MSLCETCRICGNTKLLKIIDLGDHAITSVFPSLNEPSPPKYPQSLVKCDDTSEGSDACGLVQMMHTVPASELYTDNYGYRSGLNLSMSNHLKGICELVESIVDFEYSDVIVDIGANDATLLSKYKSKNILKIAIDPSGTQFEEYYPSDVQLIPQFFDRESFETWMGIGAKAKVVTSISMFYDLPSPLRFASDVSSILSDDGIWVMEQSYMPTMITNLSFDTICHEHLEYYTLKQIEYIASKSDLKIIDVTLNDCNGGSFRVILTKRNCDKYVVNTSNIMELNKKESESRWNTITPYINFMKAVDLQRDALLSFLKCEKSNGKTIAIYGASTKGNTLLQYYGIGTDIVTCIAERNPRKYGHKTPGTEIPILSEKEVRDMNPDYMLVLPWHFKSEFVVREKQYIDTGGVFVFPLPKLDFVCNGTKSLIIGGSGQIGTYLSRTLNKKSCKVFSISRNPVFDTPKHVTQIRCDATDHKMFEIFINAVGPDEIYNLAAVADSNESIRNPERTYETNACLVFRLLVIIKELSKCKPIKFFQAGSTEIFRGNETNLTVNEKSTAFFRPLTPYAISKVSSFWAVQRARDFDGLHAVTGIFSNVESRLRKSNFVTKKIVEYFVRGDFSVPLKLGNVKSKCDWIHAQDVANFICKVIHSEEIPPCDYLVCSGTKYHIYEFVIQVAIQLEMFVEWNEHLTELRYKGKCIIEANHPSMKRNFENDVDIRFDNSKLASIYTIRNSSLSFIVSDMIEGVKSADISHRISR